MSRCHRIAAVRDTDSWTAEAPQRYLIARRALCKLLALHNDLPPRKFDLVFLGALASQFWLDNVRERHACIESLLLNSWRASGAAVGMRNT